MSVATPQVSVVIPLYNKRDTVERALRSVLAQTIQDFEIIVVNDGSTDGSADLVRGINDPRIRLLEQTNAGVSAARNLGITEARSDRIAFLDADDEWLEEFLSRVVALWHDFPNARLWATSYFFSHPTLGRRSAIIRGLDRGFRGILPNYFQLAARSEPPVWTSAVLVDKATILGVGGFPVGVRAGEDLLTWARVAVGHPIAFEARAFSVYHGPISFTDRQSRRPSPQDIVGKGLEDLLDTVIKEQRSSLCMYLALWHRMRAVTCLEAGMDRACRRETFKSAHRGGWSLRLMAMVALSFSTRRFTTLAFRAWHTLGPGYFKTRRRISARMKPDAALSVFKSLETDSKRSPRILMFASCYERGLTQQLTEQSLAFAEILRNDYLAVSDTQEQYPGLYDKLVAAKVRILPIPGLDQHRHFRALCRSFAQAVCAFEPTAVVAHTNWQFVIAATVRKQLGMRFRLAYVHHGYRHNRPIASLVARTLIGTMLSLQADKVIAPSTVLLDAFPLSRKKTVIIPLGEDGAFFDRASKVRFGGSVVQFVFPGEFRRGKNQDELIRAFERFAAKTGNKGWRLCLPGDGPLLAECRCQASASPFAENFILPGSLDRQQMLDLYDQSQFAVVPTNSETFGHCIVEPLIRGRVVISRRVGVAPDVIRHGENGFLFDTWTELEQCIAKVLSDEDLCMRVAERAFLQRDQFRWSSVCRRILEALPCSHA